VVEKRCVVKKRLLPEDKELFRMKILFVYPNHIGDTQIRLGIGYLSSYLKKFNHNTDLLDLTFGFDKDEIKKKISDFNPDLIGFSVLSPEFDFSIELASFIKENFNIPIIFGGVHPTLSPEDTIANENVDMVCVGEGELPLLELVNKMENKKDITKIESIWVKKDGKIFKNAVRQLETNLDQFPFPDRDIFDKRHFLKGKRGSPVLTTRGCPYQCTFCSNHALNKVYDFKNYVRYRTIDNVIEEINFIKKKYNVTSIMIVDDTFTVRKERVAEFCQKFKETNLTFNCMANPNSVNREMMFNLKSASCISVHMGVENGNDYIRNEVMNRHFSKSQIINAFAWAREFGLKTASFNIIGVPNETRNTVMETIQLNRLCKADVAQASIYYPFPHTRLGEYCEKNNLISDRKIKSYFSDSILELPTIKRKEMVSLQRTFQLFVSIPNYLGFIPIAFERLIYYSPDSFLGFYNIILSMISITFFSLDKNIIARLARRIKR
jgi:anaerobic magnesium-protoporphyrin IX monomethyl ester cyclase